MPSNLRQYALPINTRIRPDIPNIEGANPSTARWARTIPPTDVSPWVIAAFRELIVGWTYHRGGTVWFHAPEWPLRNCPR